MRVAAIPPKKDILNDFLDYLERRVRKLGVTLEVGKEFTADELENDKPDVVIVASGALPRFPDWKGVKESSALSVDQALSGGRERPGRRVLVIGGGGVGVETADFLSEEGCEVTIVEMLDEIASDLVVHLKHYLSERLEKKGVTVLTSTTAKELGKGYAVVQDSSGVRTIGGFDTIVLAVGSIPNDSVAKSLQGKVRELYVIGDASQPREAMEAVYEGEEVAIKI